MTNEEKPLLLIDLCARLPYEPLIRWKGNNVVLTGIMLSVYIVGGCKPYLRSMSSMTEEEKEEMCNPAIELELSYLSTNSDGPSITSIASSAYQIDWLNAHHFDYRGLIQKGLALEAPKDMYKTE